MTRASAATKANKMARAASFPKSVRASATRQIVGSPFDSDSEVSFAGGRQCRVKVPTLIEKLSANAQELKGYGRQLATDAFDAFVAHDSEESDEGVGIEKRSRTRRTRKKALNKLLDEAGRCAASLRDVADEVPDSCGLGLFRDEDDSCSSLEERPRRRRKPRKKKASEARPHDGNLTETISITTDAYSTEYNSEDSSVDSSCWSDDSAAASCQEVDSDQMARLAKLRRRRQQFLRRRAKEIAAGSDTEDEQDASVHFGRPRLGLKKQFPSQELRRKDGLTATDTVPDLVNTSNEDPLLDTSNEEESPGDATTMAKGAAQVSFADEASSRGLQNRTSNDWTGRSVSPKELKWQCIEKVIPQLSPSCNQIEFLETSHLGPLVTRTPNESMQAVGLQVGDVVIRLNAKDVSSLDATVVSGMINELAGESVRVTFLRKNMLL